MEKVSIEESTLEELKEALEKAEKDARNCGILKCVCCHSDGHNFSGKLADCGCCDIRDKLRDIVLKKEEPNQAKSVGDEKQNKPQIGKCSECKSLDKSYLIRSGFRFCTHWHNFTIENGFCHAFESEENVSEPVDKSL